MSKISVNQNEITIIQRGDQDYISLTDMVKNQDGEQHIRNWLRNKNTIEYIGTWERIHNPIFKLTEFEDFKSKAGLNRFTLSPKQWIDNTNAIGIISKSGKYGGTYGHTDIAFHFAMWLSPEFQLLVVKEYQFLKNYGSHGQQVGWSLRRFLSKVNYKLHTDAIKQYIMPSGFGGKEQLKYAEEADLLNLAVFGCTAKEWRDEYKDKEPYCDNIRDCANSYELIVLANLEAINAQMISEGRSKEERFKSLCKTAQIQLESMHNNANDQTLIRSPNKLTPETPAFDKQLKGLLAVPPPKTKK